MLTENDKITTVTCRVLLIIPWLCSLAELSSDVLMLCADSELMLEALETPRVEGGVDGAEGMV